MSKNYLDNQYFKEDVVRAAYYLSDLEQIRGKRVFITGATGLIGRMLVFTLAKMNRERSAKIKIYAVSRNVKNAAELFEEVISDGVEFVSADLTSPLKFDQNVDIVIHAAADTKSTDMVNNPIKVINSVYLATKNMLDFAKDHQVERFIYLSSMEVYGQTFKSDGLITEEFSGRVNVSSLRSSYPEAKRLAELLVRSYSKEHKFKAIILRLTQTFGSSVKLGDQRVFAQFASSALEKHEITLKTKGETVRSYVDTSDVVNVIQEMIKLDLPVGFCEVFNVADQEATISIYQMAKMISEIVDNCEIKFELGQDDSMYAPVLYMELDNSKLMAATDWAPTKNIDSMLRILVNVLKDQQSNS
ncbi:NAD-dependent epimerase/dehydratase family protein [Limosilactobacillus fermentum]|uniref:NAD-dependent epimerase/dehydratase family protein n=1 Tax=Limosilactobacillus fermentum TaxID=1613 RepID=UPI0021A4A4AB|nr:NAD(P)-dependent oxidoreductase [Limosilactobacillus fermentum]